MRGVDVKFSVRAKFIWAWNGGGGGGEGGGGSDGGEICVGVDDGSVGCIGCWEGGGDKSAGEGVASFEGVILDGDSSCDDGGMGVCADISSYIKLNFVI